MSDADRCIGCNKIIPEGRHLCEDCEQFLQDRDTAEQAIKALRWLEFNFPKIEAQSEADKMCNCIHEYCKRGADVIEALLRKEK